jgi:hypothetical protein
VESYRFARTVVDVCVGLGSAAVLVAVLRLWFTLSGPKMSKVILLAAVCLTTTVPSQLRET